MTPRDAIHVEPAAMAQFQEVLACLAREFPLLTVEPEFDQPHADAIADIPRQAGLDFGLSINLQYDELQLNVGDFCLGWFPCTDPAIARSFAETACGLLRGECRIVEHLNAGRAVKAQLQRQAHGAWKTIGTWCSPAGHFPWLRPKRLVQNRGHLASGELPGQPQP